MLFGLSFTKSDLCSVKLTSIRYCARCNLLSAASYQHLRHSTINIAQTLRLHFVFIGLLYTHCAYRTSAANINDVVVKINIADSHLNVN
jgi:hypothetical protein